MTKKAIGGFILSRKSLILIVAFCFMVTNATLAIASNLDTGFIEAEKQKQKRIESGKEIFKQYLRDNGLDDKEGSSEYLVALHNYINSPTFKQTDPVQSLVDSYAQFAFLKAKARPLGEKMKIKSHFFCKFAPQVYLLS